MISVRRLIGLSYCVAVGGLAVVAYADQSTPPPVSDTTARSAPSDELAEITVTATRQAESLSHVPLSVAAISQAQMDAQGVKTIDDVIRLTPGITINRTGNNTNEIAIRGISSPAGAATTGIYIDDVPVQARNLGYAAGTVYPLAFDLERVEVLRGPQGTLFGAGSEGGTVRFIQPEPSLKQFSAYARAEVSSIENGGIGNEAGLAVGGPIIQDVLGFRLSAYQRHDAGWINAETGTFSILDPSGNSGAGSIAFAPVGIADNNANWGQDSSARLALTVAPTDALKITASVFYQKQYVHDDALSDYWPSLSEAANGQYVIPRFVAGAADATHLAMTAPAGNPSNDRFYLPALKIEYANSVLRITSDTSYFDRNHTQTVDHTQLYTENFGHLGVPRPGDRAITNLLDRQRIFTQELRVQSADPEARLNWLVGAFYSRNHQGSVQAELQNFTYFLPAYFGAVTDGPPFGPGYNAYINALGVPPLANGVSYSADFETREEQLAGFGQADFKITEALKVTAGVRFAHNKIAYSAVYNGPEQNYNGPYGACPPTNPVDPATGACSPYIAPATGPFTPFYGGGSASNAQNATTPKVGISYQADPNNLLYGSVSKGFRPPGAQAALTTGCNGDLIQNGFVDSHGNALSPTTYKSDSVWSYELGSKNRLLNGRLVIDGSVYLIKWTDIQSNINLNDCASVITTNLGKATARGFDLAVQLRPISSLTLGTAVGYNKTSFDQALVSATTGQTIYHKGTAVPGSGAPWSATVNAQYNLNLSEHDFYLRGDYTYTSRFYRTGQTDPGTNTYDPLDQPQQAAALLNLRAGVLLGAADVSVFMNNATDTHPSLGFIRTAPGFLIFSDRTFQPRTVGLTASYRY